MAEITKVSTKGQIVIPNELRKRLKISDGDTIQIEQVGDLIVLKKVELSSLAKELQGTATRQQRGGKK